MYVIKTQIIFTLWLTRNTVKMILFKLHMCAMDYVQAASYRQRILCSPWILHFTNNSLQISRF